MSEESLFDRLNRSPRKSLYAGTMEAAGIEPAFQSLPISVAHAPASTEDMIRWLEDADQTITADLRRQIAERLKDLKTTRLFVAASRGVLV